MKTIKRDILQTFIIIIIFNFLGILIFGSLEVYMLYILFNANTLQNGHTYITVSNSLHNYNGATIDLLIPIVGYIILFFSSVIIFMIKINGFIKEINIFNENTKNTLDTLNVINKDYSYLELNRGSEAVNDAVLKIKKNKFLEKELINFTMHDIKTPLHIISGYNELSSLKGKNIYGAKIDVQLQKVNQIIENTLMSDGDLVLEEVDVVFIINELIKDYELIYINNKFVVNCNETSVMWKVHKLSFNRIIMNLVDNAIEASENNGLIKIGINAKEIYVKNYGHILTENDYLKYISEEEISLKGIGLKIVKRYCDKNNLLVKIDSAQDYTKVKILPII